MVVSWTGWMGSWVNQSVGVKKSVLEGVELVTDSDLTSELC